MPTDPTDSTQTASAATGQHPRPGAPDRRTARARVPGYAGYDPGELPLRQASARLSRRGLIGAGGLATAAAAATLAGAAPAAGTTGSAASTPGDPSIPSDTSPPSEPHAFAPVPDNARGPAIPDVGYLVEEIRHGLYWVTEGVYQAVFLETRSGVVLVDAPPTLEDAIPAAIREVTSKPVTHFVYSHSHGDHVGVAGRLLSRDGELTRGRRPVLIGHRDTARQLRTFADPLRPVPSLVFGRRRSLELGSQRIDLVYPGPNHEPGNVFVHFPDQRTLLLIDVVFPGWVPFKNLAIAEDVPGFIEAHDEALDFEFDTFVGGHLTRLGDRRDVEDAREYVLDVRDATEQALLGVDLGAIISEVGTDNPWALFDRYLDAVSAEAAQPVLDKWLGRLGGADVFTEDHTFTMATPGLRIDENLVARPDVI